MTKIEEKSHSRKQTSSSSSSYSRSSSSRSTSSSSRSSTSSSSNSLTPRRSKDRSSRHSRERSRSRKRSESRSQSSKYHKSEKSRKLCVSNITRNVTEEHLNEIFSMYGKLEYVRLPMDRILRLHKGIAYISYFEHEDAVKAFEHMSGGTAWIDGQHIKCEFVFDQKRNSHARKPSSNYSRRYRKSPPYRSSYRSSNVGRSRMYSPRRKVNSPRYNRRRNYSRSKTRSPSSYSRSRSSSRSLTPKPKKSQKQGSSSSSKSRSRSSRKN